METIREEAQETPVAAECDVCVVGGSCTGVFAAVRAARLGANVAIVESGGFFGGVATAGLVNVWHSLHDTAAQQQIIAGLTQEVVERLRRRGAVDVRPRGSNPQFVLNTAELIIELDELVGEAGVRPFLHARFARPIVDGGRVAAAVIEDKTGRRAIRAEQFIDATGDGDVIARAGLPTYKDEVLQPPTTVAILHGLAKVRQANPGFSLSRAVFDSRYPEALKSGFLWTAPVPGVADATMVAGTRVFGADCSDADERTRAEAEGRRQVRAICDLLRKHIAGGQDVALAALASCIGIRETRHARCLHTLTEREVLTGERFDDAVANGSYHVDVHHADGEGLTFRNLDGTEQFVAADGTRREGRWRPPREQDPTFYQIPYRSLVPRGAANVLAAGRAIDADRGAFGAVRVMVNCNQTGEAAGTAAFLALDAGAAVADVDAERLRRTLKDGGSIVL
jgi:hypothetical protein